MPHKEVDHNQRMRKLDKKNKNFDLNGKYTSKHMRIKMEIMEKKGFTNNDTNNK